MRLTSPAFTDASQIPQTYTCDGEGVSPPLIWDIIPEGAQSMALIVDDPDAPDPDAPRHPFVHWVVFNLEPDRYHLDPCPAGKCTDGRPGVNDWGKVGYGGPCPPKGRHRYFFKLYALDTKLELERPTKADLERAMQGHVLGKAELVGTYERRH